MINFRFHRHNDKFSEKNPEIFSWRFSNWIQNFPEKSELFAAFFWSWWHQVTRQLPLIPLTIVTYYSYEAEHWARTSFRMLISIPYFAECAKRDKESCKLPCSTLATLATAFLFSKTNINFTKVWHLNCFRAHKITWKYLGNTRNSNLRFQPAAFCVGSGIGIKWSILSDFDRVITDSFEFKLMKRFKIYAYGTCSQCNQRFHGSEPLRIVPIFNWLFSRSLSLPGKRHKQEENKKNLIN